MAIYHPPFAFLYWTSTATELSDQIRKRRSARESGNGAPLAIFSIPRGRGILKNSVQRVALRASDGLEFFCELFVQHPGRIISNRDPEIAQFFKNTRRSGLASASRERSHSAASSHGSMVLMTLQSHGFLWGSQHSGHHQDEPESQQNEFGSRGMLPLALRKRS